MTDINIIDKFTNTFVDYIDSGFGLLEGEVAFLTSILVGIDIVLAGLFWAWGANTDVIQSFVKKVLYVGFFALILNHLPYLTDTIFQSFSGLGLKATGATLTHEDLLQPGFVAAEGFKAAHPIIDEIRKSFGLTDILNPFSLATALVLIISWLLVLVSFFVIAIQLFVTIIEFKLTTLAGFVLVPFALWRGTAFLAERVLGSVISAGIKVMVLAVVIGIGATLFGEITSAIGNNKVEMEDAMIMVLAALTLAGLSIFAPGIAAGLVSGAPQLGAGAALATVGGAAAGAVAGAGLVVGAARMAGGAAMGAAKAASKTTGAASTAYNLGKNTSASSGAGGVAAGFSGVASAGAGAAGRVVRSAGSKMKNSMEESFAEGGQQGWQDTGGTPFQGGGNAPASSSEQSADVPAWAKRMRRQQHVTGAARVTREVVREGDRPGAPANPTLKDGDE